MTLAPYEGYAWQGERVRLRPLKAEDAEKKWREWTDSEARVMLEYGMDLPPVSLETYREQLGPFDFSEQDKRLNFAIDTLNGEFVGWLGFDPRDQRNGVCGVSIAVFREYRGNGYATEAMRLVLRYAFRELRMQKCNSACLDVNEASIALHTRLGFKKEGRRRRIAFTGGEFHDEILFGLLKEEYETLDSD